MPDYVHVELVALAGIAISQQDGPRDERAIPIEQAERETRISRRYLEALRDDIDGTGQAVACGPLDVPTNSFGEWWKLWSNFLPPRDSDVNTW